MGIETALLVGGGLAAAGALGGSAVQAVGANKAAKRANKLGQQAQGIISEGENRQAQAVQQGYGRAQDYQRQAQDILGTGYGRLDQAFGQERQVGSEGLQALRNAILGGGQQALQMDPGYQFRLSEGQRAINNAAAASGDLGGSRYYQNTARFSQGLASDEYSKAVQRLAGLAGIGQQANANYANLGQQLLGQQANVYGNQSQLAAGMGTSLANLYQQNAIARSNALTGAGTQANQLQLAATNAIAQGIGGAANAGNSVLGQYAFLNAIGGGGFGGGGGGNLLPTNNNYASVPYGGYGSPRLF